MVKLQNRIKELRERKGLTLKMLSSTTGFSTSAINRWENGIRGLDKDKAHKLSKVLEVQPSELFLSEKGVFQLYWQKEKNIQFQKGKFVLSITRQGKRYSKTFEILEDAIKHRDNVLREYENKDGFPKTRKKENILKYQELIGQKFQRLTVIKLTGPKKKENVSRTYSYAICRCECGRICEVEIFNLLKGKNYSCGCLALEKSRDLGAKFGRDRKTREKARISNILNPSPRKTNKTTRIKNITYSSKLKSYRVQIIRDGVRYTKRFPTLAEAMDYKNALLKELDEKLHSRDE
ncbi:helix-turn-helix domain-containing protein [Streptococcus sp. HMSC070B10]|jgi:DNA-binding helix-turn-helix protein|uniref:helix-turn-helix domain-containing protein n=1 Tax=Streptococcus sp. HMSC070B10 TaxID=1715092 RepID=UPI0008A1CC2E|nr:helix-turn-helix transcriptional regulator [Streptococcus sp. HMSC070B10]OFO01906.1 hypothetical protein HMPREF2613_08150 [Streptococcus sp. HMSC070B10]